MTAKSKGSYSRKTEVSRDERRAMSDQDFLRHQQGRALAQIHQACQRFIASRAASGPINRIVANSPNRFVKREPQPQASPRLTINDRIALSGTIARAVRRGVIDGQIHATLGQWAQAVMQDAAERGVLVLPDNRAQIDADERQAPRDGGQASKRRKATASNLAQRTGDPAGIPP